MKQLLFAAASFLRIINLKIADDICAFKMNSELYYNKYSLCSRQKIIKKNIKFMLAFCRKTWYIITCP